MIGVRGEWISSGAIYIHLFKIIFMYMHEEIYVACQYNSENHNSADASNGDDIFSPFKVDNDEPLGAYIYITYMHSRPYIDRVKQGHTPIQ